MFSYISKHKFCPDVHEHNFYKSFLCGQNIVTISATPVLLVHVCDILGPMPVSCVYDFVSYFIIFQPMKIQFYC